MSIFNVTNNDDIITQQFDVSTVNIITIDHVDIDPERYGQITLHYVDGTTVPLKFYGNGGLVFLYNNQASAKLKNGVWNLQNILQLPKTMTAYCSNTYMKNTWEFCTQGLSHVEFFTNTMWSGMNSVKLFSMPTVPLYLRETTNTMQESSEKLIISTKNFDDATYFKNRLENYHKNKFYNYEKVNLVTSKYHNSDEFVITCKSGNITALIKKICNSTNFFTDHNGFVCCKSRHDIELLNKYIGTNL